MTASLYAKALYWGCRQVLLLRCLPPWRRMQLLVLKAVAISGYYAGRLANQWHSLEKAQLPAPAAADSAATANTCTAHGRSFPTPAGAGSSSQACPCVVVVPAYISTARQAARLQRLVTRLLLEQRQPPSAVAVVDDASPLSAANVLACFQHQPAGAGPLLLVHRLPANHGPAAARNAGLALAAAMGARVVAFTDDDCLPSCDWVGSMLTAQAACPGIVGGRTCALQPGTAVGLFHDVFGTLNGRQSPDGSLLYACTCNLSMSLSLGQPSQPSARHLLLFDETFPTAAFEDVEFCVRARKAGIRLSYAPAATVQHDYDCSVAGLFRQFARYGAQERLMCSKHPEYLGWLHASADVPSLA